ncbi:MAG: DUF4272 domain-containing protein [Oscillospiraceae bacterium]|jgi:hypothetical protein|nr:DUF4272 domain-containing protein [Oscillospiraceae bacterium]
MTIQRTTEDIAKRAVALCIVAMYADDLRRYSSIKKSRMFIAVVCESFTAADFFSSSERAFIVNDSPDSATIVSFVWMYECLNALMFALGYTDTLGALDSFCDIDRCITIVNEKRSFETFLEEAQPRDPAEIAAATEEYEQIREHGEGNQEIVAARLRALNWLVGVEETEEIW